MELKQLDLPSGSIRIAADAVASTEYDRVMPVLGDEAMLLSNRLSLDPGRRVLDLGTGSGILAVAAARAGARVVVGVDINPKALRYAKRNALANGCNDTCSFRQGDMWEPVRHERFDTIVSNPPFVPTPFGFQLFLSADGGPMGLGVAERVLQDVRTHLSSTGKLLLLTMSLGDENEPLVYSLLRRHLGSAPVCITSTHIYNEERIEAESFLCLYSRIRSYAEWRRYLSSRRMTHLYYMLHEVVPSHRFCHTEVCGAALTDSDVLSGTWSGRLSRYRLWLSRLGRNRDETAAIHPV